MGAARYVRALDLVFALRARFAGIMGEIDIILTPTSSALPWDAEKPFPAEIDGQKVGPRGGAIFTTFVNAIGHPAIALPAAPSDDGLPIGFQLVARFGAEALLLALAADFEAAKPWADRWPALAEDGGT